MSPSKIPPVTVSDDETLARFVFRSKDVRPNSTLKPEVFIPYPHPNLSVTRHIGLQDGEIWEKGNMISLQRSLPLIGRGDIGTAEFRRHRLRVDAAPIPENAHHANVTAWPDGKAAQKNIAQEISAVVRFMPKPDTPGH
jgi:hypothetical protein